METISLRDYFIAHAPAEPQPWFEPEMPDNPMPKEPTEMTKEERLHLNYWQTDYFETEEIPPGRILDYVKQREAWAKQETSLERDRKRQRYIQWPAAWADAMLEMRSRGGDG